MFEPQVPRRLRGPNAQDENQERSKEAKNDETEKDNVFPDEPPTGPAREILEHLATLAIAMTQVELDEMLRGAEQGSWSHMELLDRLLGEVRSGNSSGSSSGGSARRGS